MPDEKQPDEIESFLDHEVEEFLQQMHNTAMKPEPTPSKGTTQEEVRARVLSVFEDLLAGKTDVDICVERSQEWGLKQGSVRPYLQKARALMTDMAELQAQSSYAWHIQNRLRLLRMAESAGDLKSALSISQDLAKLQRVYDNKLTLQHTGPEELVAALLRGISEE